MLAQDLPASGLHARCRSHRDKDASTGGRDGRRLGYHSCFRYRRSRPLVRRTALPVGGAVSFGLPKALPQRSASTLIRVRFPFAIPLDPGESDRRAKQSQEVADVNARFVVELDLGLRCALWVGRNEGNTRRDRFCQLFDPSDDLLLFVRQRGVAPLTLDCRVLEESIATLAAFPDAGPLPPNHIGAKASASSACSLLS